MIISRQLTAALQTAIGNKKNVVYLNNTAANGADRYIAPYETLIFVNNSASWTQQLYLPPVSESVGVIITIITPDTGGHTTISDRNDSGADWTDLVTDADNEYAVLYNDGQGWKVLVTDIT